MPDWLLIAAAVVAALYLALVAALLVLGRRHDARVRAAFVPDCVVLFKRLLADPRLSRRRKLLIGALVGYLALPCDLIPGFIPVVGHLDDAIVVALVLRTVLRAAGPGLVSEYWPGPPTSLAVVSASRDPQATGRNASSASARRAAARAGHGWCSSHASRQPGDCRSAPRCAQLPSLVAHE